MNDEIEQLTGVLHRATQTGCSCWKPIASRMPDKRDGLTECPAIPDSAEFLNAPIEKKPA
jgi:hypothetical protein